MHAANAVYTKFENSNYNYKWK